jgi:hypothetical protein
MAIGVSLIDMYVRGLDGEAAPIGRHGIARVHREIEDGGLQLVRIRFDAPDAAPRTVSSETVSPKVRCGRSDMPETSMLMSRGLGSSSCRLENARSVNEAARLATFIA